MRELKFRAWDKKEKSMYNWHEDYHSILDAIARDCGDEWTERCEVMQFTGLLDARGREIWEGDILKCSEAGKPYYAAIEWVDNGFWINGLHGKFLPNREYREVVGTIYENPELLSEPISSEGK